MKRILSLILTWAFLLGMLLTLPGCFSLRRIESSGEVTRGEWIQMLSEAFGMSSELTVAPSFTDVPEDDARFASVEACVAWQILDGGGRFQPNRPAARTFIAMTALKAADTDGGDDPLATAVEYGLLLSAAQPDDGLTEDECRLAIDAALALYQSQHTKEYANIVFADSIIDYSSQPAGSIVTDGSTAILSAELGAGLQPGDIFLSPADSENPDGIALKVESVETVDGQTRVTTSEPAIEELYETLDFSATVVPDAASLVPGEGVTLDAFAVEPIAAGTEDADVTPLTAADADAGREGASFSFKVSFSDGQVTLNPEYGSLSGELTEGSSTPPFYRVNGRKIQKFKSGSKIEGEIKVSEFYIETQFTANPCHYRQVVHYNLEYDLSFTGTMSADQRKLALGKINVPICPGVSAYVTLNLEVEAEGELHINSSMSCTTTTECSARSGIKKVSEQEAQDSWAFQGELKVYAGPKISLSTLGIILADLYLKVGLESEGTFKGYDNRDYCIDLKTYLPLVKLEFCTDNGSVLNKLKFKFTWNIIDRENAPMQPGSHYESGIGWVDECSREPGTGPWTEPVDVTSSATPSAGTKVWDEAYSSVLLQYQSFVLQLKAGSYDGSLGEPWDTIAWELTGIGSLPEFGYAYRDMDSNGSPELFILLKDVELSIMGVFTLDGGSPLELGNYWSRNRCALDSSDSFYIYASNGAGNYSINVCRIAENGRAMQLIEIYKVITDMAEESAVSHYVHEDLLTGTVDEIDEAAFSAAAAAFPTGNADSGLVFLPLSGLTTSPTTTAAETTPAVIRQTGTFLSVEWGDYMHVQILGDDGIEYSFFVLEALAVDPESIEPGQRVVFEWTTVQEYLDPPGETMSIEGLVSLELQAEP